MEGRLRSLLRVLGVGALEELFQFMFHYSLRELCCVPLALERMCTSKALMADDIRLSLWVLQRRCITAGVV